MLRDTASELAPVSKVAVAALELHGGERMLDLACGTGNAALLAAASGAQVTGLDASARLLEVAHDRVPGAEFVPGNATELPFDDGEFDAAVSVFGIIFARPAERAAAEIARVVRPGGRLAITAWLPRGPMSAPVMLMRQAMARVRALEGPPAVNWGDRAVLERLLEPYGRLQVTEHELPYEHAMPEKAWDQLERQHPMWIAARGLLEPAGEWDGLRVASIAALHGSRSEGSNTSPYLLAVLERSSPATAAAATGS